MIQNPHLFEIAAWPWLERLSRENGRRVTLANVPGAYWDEIARLGFNCVFLMGVWRRSPIGRDIARKVSGLVAEYDRVLPGWTDDDVPGSPYCIQAYEPDDRMGGWPGLDAARQQLNARGLALIVDFVPNHTAFDHAWIANHPERYVLGTKELLERSPQDFRATAGVDGQTNYIACARDPYFPPWTDVAQLNYFNPDTREAMIGILRTLAMHCDGVRCDMAMLVFNDLFERTWRWLLENRWPIPTTGFWPEATRTASQLIYVAEVYWDLESRVLEEGFNFAYDKRLLDALHASDRAGRVRAVLSAGNPPPARLARFIENHDEPRSAATLAPILPACASLLATVPGLRFFFDGQLSGAAIKAPVQLGRWPDHTPDPAIRTVYERALQFGLKPVLHDGAWRILNMSPASDDTWHNIVAYRWRLNDEVAVVVLNFGLVASEAHVHVADDLGPARAFGFEDALTGNTYQWTRESLEARGLWVRLDAGQAHLFTVRGER